MGWLQTAAAGALICVTTPATPWRPCVATSQLTRFHLLWKGAFILNKVFWSIAPNLVQMCFGLSFSALSQLLHTSPFASLERSFSRSLAGTSPGMFSFFPRDDFGHLTLLWGEQQAQCSVQYGDAGKKCCLIANVPRNESYPLRALSNHRRQIWVHHH